MTSPSQKYSVNQYHIEVILAWIQSREIAIPEIQRPFVWDASAVRDLMDSLYQGFPIGYLIAWKNPNIRLKDGTVSEGKKVLIDGQQRVTALTAAILGQRVVDKEYRRVRINIAFNPLKKQFEVQNPAILKDSSWIPDIAELFRTELDIFKLVGDYCAKNAGISQQEVFNRVQRLQQVKGKQIGLIELDADLDIETVTEIFVRINSKGVMLSQADFAMSKIAANEEYQGSHLRKCIDYFCHLAIAPEFYDQIRDCDPEFAATPDFQRMAWLRHENDDLYDPGYSDVLRVAFTSEFQRGKLSDLVSLLSGRNFETKTFEEPIAEQSFARLRQGVENFSNETNFKRFIMILRAAGFVDSSLIRSQNAVNFAYILFLKLRAADVPPQMIESAVPRWFVMSILTGRYSGSPESSFDFDIKQVATRNIDDVLRDHEAAELSEAFWSASLVQALQTSVASNPNFLVFLAAQIRSGDKGFLSKEISVHDLVTHKGDIHHIFPKDYLKKNGLGKADYNQIANYAYMQSEINIRLGNRAPKEYFEGLREQCAGGDLKFGSINSTEVLTSNLRMNAVPESIVNYELNEYETFLSERRRLMAAKMREYYFSL
ncbi:MAG: DUF262 domain-containing protein [Verrucomicrobia bacterium]|nr:DUF262 domain-containing protein [Verrucomicrobiota bacterium]